MSIAHFSDYVRIALLEKYGGVWMDSTLLLTGPIPENILRSDFFMPVTSVYNFNLQVPSYEVMASMAALYYPGNASLIGTNWMIAAKKGSSLVKAMKILLEEYWNRENHVIDYLFFLYLMQLAISFNTHCRREFLSMPKITNVYPNLLRMSYEKPFSAKFVEEAKALSFVHKMTYKNVKDIQQKKNYRGSLIEHIIQYGI